MILRPSRFSRTAREACSVSRACPVEIHSPRRSIAGRLVVVAAIGIVALVALQLKRSGG